MKKEQAKMKLALIFLTAAAAVLQLHAAVPLSWTVETSRAQPATFEAYQGETIDFEAALLQAHGKTLEAPLNYSFFWQTNGMGSTYWEAPARPVPASSLAGASTNVLFATWLPVYDVGAKVYNCFIGSPSNIYHAAFQLRLRPSPGALPNALPLPVPVIDFARVRVLNPPWSGGGGSGVDTNAVIDIANATIATNPVVAAKLDGPTFAPTNIAEYADKAADARLTGIALTNRYTKSEVDAELEGKISNGAENAAIGTLLVDTISGSQGTTMSDDFTIGDPDSPDHALSAKANRAALEAATNALASSVSSLQSSKADQSEVDQMQETLGEAYSMAASASSWVAETGQYKADRAESGHDGEIATLDDDGNIVPGEKKLTDLAEAENPYLLGNVHTTGDGAGHDGDFIILDRDLSPVHRLSLKADRLMISATDPTFSNEVATVARTVTPPPSPTLRLYDEVRQCYWIGKMVNGVMQWEVE